MISSDFQLWKQRGRTSGGIFSPFLPSSASRIPHFASVMFAWVLGPSSPNAPLRPSLPAPHGLPTPAAYRKAFSAVRAPACFPKQTSSLERYSFRPCVEKRRRIYNEETVVGVEDFMGSHFLFLRAVLDCSLSSSVEGYFVHDGTFLMVSAT